jgi:prepilin-type N-terminal cleavage/methylation domain-containing protein
VESLSPERGITLLEMLIVVGLIALLAGISYPAMTAGIDSLRIGSAASSVVTFLNSGLNRAERRQHAVEFTIVPTERLLRMASAEPGFVRELRMPDGVAILAVLPPVPMLEEAAPRQFLVYPAGAPPRIGVVLGNRRGDRRIVSVDPITGVPRVERPEALP